MLNTLEETLLLGGQNHTDKALYVDISAQLISFTYSLSGLTDPRYKFRSHLTEPHNERLIIGHI